MSNNSVAHSDDLSVPGRVDAAARGGEPLHGGSGPDGAVPAPPPMAWREVGAVVLIAAIVTVFTACRYHLFGDELYFVAAGRHPAWSYADQGPMIPLLARLGDVMPGHTLLGFRFVGVILTVAAVLIAALTARELGGGRAAQVLTAVACATSPILVQWGALLCTNCVDTPIWTTVTWLMVRWVRTRSDRLLLAAGVLTAIDMQDKWLIPLLWVGIGVGCLAYGPRELLRRPLLWVGGAITVASTIPGVVWQAQHGWPQLKLTGVVAYEDGFVGGRWILIPAAISGAGILGAILLVYGAWRLARSQFLRRYRFVLVAAVVVVAAVVISGGRATYPSGLFAVLIAAGAVEATRGGARRWARWAVTPVVVASMALVSATIPYKPADTVTVPTTIYPVAVNMAVYGQFGWPGLSREVEGAIAALPPDRRPRAIVTDFYWTSSALEYYGRDALPPVYSYNRGYYYFGRPAGSAVVLWIGDRDDLTRPRAACAEMTRIGTVGGDLPGVVARQLVMHHIGFPVSSAGLALVLCTPRAPWAQTWPTLDKI
ncbi:ArnT family glycosyltransferase [Tsukamurella soli]|uniref:ArnT family glycosyltransferase n=1 Tax=Tsukamurella soli TaxID=644556 RepID=UPI0031EF178C